MAGCWMAKTTKRNPVSESTRRAAAVESATGFAQHCNKQRVRASPQVLGPPLPTRGSNQPVPHGRKFIACERLRRPSVSLANWSRSG